MYTSPVLSVKSRRIFSDKALYTLSRISILMINRIGKCTEFSESEV